MKTPFENRSIRLAFISILFLMSCCAFTQSEDLIIELDKVKHYGYLQFDNPKGSVNINGYEGNMIIVTGTPRFREKGQDQQVSYRKISQPRFSLSAEVKDNNVLLICESYGNTIDFDIQVPNSMSVKIKCLDNGEVSVYSINGEIEIENEYGNIFAGNISGSSVINTTYGNIRVVFKELVSGKPCMFTSFDGDIEVVFPENEKASLKISSPGGEILSQVNLKTYERKARLQSDQDIKRYTLENWTTATLNGGGTEIIISSYSGNIILKHKKDVTFQF